MDFQTITILVLMGVLVGIVSGFIGIGGGLLIVPAMVFFFNFTQYQAQGVSIATLLLPIGSLAFYNYYQAGHIPNKHLWYALILSMTFVVGSYIGSKLTLKIDPRITKIVFSGLLFYVGFKMLMSGLTYFQK